jgi:hypothetical protein
MAEDHEARIARLEKAVADIGAYAVKLEETVTDLAKWKHGLFNPKDTPIHHAENIIIPTAELPPHKYQAIHAENIELPENKRPEPHGDLFYSGRITHAKNIGE